ncbi:gamma-glutamyltransferase [Actinomycetospora sp. NBRC 106378]|uniref:gamma-glutamyltransferase n=1 Tax=Actinomycetospora sp. NBRC 106378 TaxID=3032208 RepID=UPI0024A3FE01|nr:gamma-glutamyltransferase [Actinomycetospora sp. NBRC 106378]GLZ54315.1 gamma-glutamyltransferase [Actinomycetospora sp. NBRC 106378]
MGAASPVDRSRSVPLRRLAERSGASGATGAVAAGSGTAAAIGFAQLLRGGSAVDAVLAAALAETVLLPSKAGLAGDLVALVHRAGGAPEALTAIGPAPAGLADLAVARGWRMPLTGGPAVGVPGAPAGYAALAERARLGLGELAAPAIDVARAGVAWSRTNVRLVAASAGVLREHQPEGCVFLPASGPRPAGARVRLPGLARVLEEFVARREGLFGAELGAAVVERVRRAGGVLDAHDLAAVAPRAAEWSPAPVVDLASGPRLWTTPAPSYGTALAEAVAGGGPVPDAVRAALSRMRRDRTPARSDGTSAVAAVDAEGTSAVVVHSNSFPQFGSGLVVDGYDLVLANRAGRGFTFVEGHPNAPAPGRRPRTTLHAWALGDPGAPLLLGATPGGEQQVPWNAQLLADLLAGVSPDEALVRPRWELDAAGDLRAEGTDLPELGASSSHVLVGTGPEGLVSAWADPRLEGLAVAG